MTPEAHDQAMDIIQGVEHFSKFCLGLFLKEIDADLESLMALSSPVYKMEMSILGRLFYQDPKLYADIILSSEKRTSLIQKYNQILINSADMLQNRDKDVLIEKFTETADWMGSFTGKAFNVSEDFLDKQSK